MLIIMWSPEPEKRELEQRTARGSNKCAFVRESDRTISTWITHCSTIPTPLHRTSYLVSYILRVMILDKDEDRFNRDFASYDKQKREEQHRIRLE